MRTQTLTLVVALLLASAVTAAVAHPTEGPAQKPEALQLTAEEQAFVDRAEALRNEMEIAGMELALLEAKDASEGDIAAKAEQLYGVRGELYALRATNRELAAKLWRGRAGDRWQHRGGRGMGRGMGQGPRYGPRHGPRYGPWHGPR